MQKTLIALATIAATSFSPVALAEEVNAGPVILTDVQMEEVVAGTPANINNWDHCVEQGIIETQAKSNGFKGMNVHAAGWLATCP